MLTQIGKILQLKGMVMAFGFEHFHWQVKVESEALTSQKHSVGLAGAKKNE